ncbi:SAF domain-containing protein [Nocardioides sp. W7]|uniref:SAF domain-containing protein n=1 Tax=Nocardioides sp. W7 TaxID=2931390 RepID=UPI001FD301C5|nr:SAF domain-containing protein [Nocardioides sp. W7]
MLPDVAPSARRPLRALRALRSVRRAVLAHRRLLAAALAAVAVAAGLQASAAPPPATVPVTVAARDVPAGRVLAPGDLATAAFAPGTAPDDLATEAVGRVLASPLRRGEPVTDVRLVGPALTEGHPGRVALPVRLPDAGMAGLLRVGDVVDLVAADPQGGKPTLVAAEVPVLALPAGPAEHGGTGGTALGGRLVVVGARPDDVPVIADAAARLFLSYAWRV